MIEKKIIELIKPVIEENSLILDSVNYEKEGNSYVLQVVIDKEGIIDVEDCVTVTKLINPLLDEIDIIDNSYILDVCSKEKGSM